MTYGEMIPVALIVVWAVTGYHIGRWRERQLAARRVWQMMRDLERCERGQEE